MTFTPVITGGGLAGYSLLVQTRERQQAAFNASVPIARDVTAFGADLETLRSADDLLGNRAALRVALGAFGLEEDINNTAFLRSVLNSDLADETSFANRLRDPRYLGLARAFGFNSADGPQIGGTGVIASLSQVQSAEALLADSRALRSVLQTFGLQRDENNIFFLQRVLESDVSDPASFANGLRDPVYAQLAGAFDFAGRAVADNPVAAFLDAAEGKLDRLVLPQQLLRDEALLSASVTLFDLPNDDPLLLERVLSADPTDPASLVNQMTDKRYLAFSEAFRLGWPNVTAITDPEVFLANAPVRAEMLDAYNISDRGDDFFRDLLTSDLSDPASFANQPDNAPFLPFAEAFQSGLPRQPSPAQRFVAALAGEINAISGPSDVILNFDVQAPVLTFFGVGRGNNTDTLGFLQRVLGSDLSNPQSVAALHPDKRNAAFAKAFAFNPGANAPRYPDGFADFITGLYQERSFEVAVGAQNVDMRLALSLERDLGEIAGQAVSNDAKWFQVLGAPPLREVFQTAFRLPGEFAGIDIDQQLVEIKARAQSVLGTDELRDLVQPEVLDDLRRRFLGLSQASGFTGTPGSQSAALALLQAAPGAGGGLLG
ncbi:MAG: DUF1217 domain-containing protein [Pseudomonadota bacterium]